MFVVCSEVRDGLPALIGSRVAADHHGVTFRRVQAVRQLEKVEREVVHFGWVPEKDKGERR